MAPIRVGLVGLSGTATVYPGPGSWASVSHLPSILNSPDYELVALANSSVESAKKAISLHKLSTSIKAYGSSEELAKDPDVDLVVVSVNVAKHYAATKPALLAKKDVFVEWPLGVNSSEAAELTQLAQQNGVKTAVIIQGRAMPLTTALKKIVNSGEIGEITSTVVSGTFGFIPRDVWFPGAEYYLDINSGGNSLTIYLGHCTFSYLSQTEYLTELVF
jgi:predicted dehydrogenase